MPTASRERLEQPWHHTHISALQCHLTLAISTRIHACQMAAAGIIYCPPPGEQLTRGAGGFNSCAALAPFKPVVRVVDQQM